MSVLAEINFYALIKGSAGKEGGRERFERLIAQLVKVKHSSARRVTANPGDWGLDIIVGELTDEAEALAVWQAKFFIDGVNAAQQRQIRDALKHVMENAKKEGFRVDSWTLCIPVSLDAGMTTWWDGWKKRKEKEHGIRIQLWDDTELEALLLTADAKRIRDTYFGDGVTGSTSDGALEATIEELPDDRDFDDMLFIKQLKAANVTEVESAKHQFFNAEILSRDVADRGVVEEINQLSSSRAGVHAIWENKFNQRCTADADDDLLPGLHADVMEAIQTFHYAEQPQEKAVRMALIHRWGSVHEIVDTGRAGWIRAFRKIAGDHGR
jgi:hypothetical protein